MKIYKSGIAVAAPETPEDRITVGQAADEMLNISGIQASFVVFLENDKIGISARSIGSINVQLIVEKLGGGGTKDNAGAQIAGKSQREVVVELLSAIDAYLDDSDNV